MKIFRILSCLAALLMLAASCGGSGSRLDDFNLDLFTPKYSSGFDIRGAEGRESVLLTVRNPWQGADSVVTTLFVARGGEDVPDGYTGPVLRGEAARIVAMSSTQIAMLEAIGEDGRVYGVSGIEYISNPHIQARRDEVADVGYEGNINYELIVALDPDIVLLYGVSGASSMEGKLTELGIPFMYVGDYLEESPLGKAEWMVALAELAGCREKGESAFAAIPERYNALKRKVAESSLPAPKVMINTPYGDTWYMASADSYVARLIADAGGDYIYRKNTANSSLPIDMEEAWLLVSEADVWINIGPFNTDAELHSAISRFADTPPVKSGELYSSDRAKTPAGGNDYWETGVVRPDIVLRDLVRIFHHELVNEEFVYYRKLK